MCVCEGVCEQSTMKEARARACVGVRMGGGSSSVRVRQGKVRTEKAIAIKPKLRQERLPRTRFEVTIDLLSITFPAAATSTLSTPHAMRAPVSLP